MAGIKISALPAVGSALLTDSFPVVQSSVTSRETLLQVATLLGFDVSTHLLALDKGGTNASLTAVLGAVPYSTASAIGLVAPGLSGQVFLSAGAASPVWSTATYPATASTSGKVIVSDGTNFSSSFTTGITGLGTQAQALNMGTHKINNVVNPTLAQDAATKAYVDQTALTGTAVYAATTVDLVVTQSGSGVGATLTNADTQATFALDGVNPPMGSNVLIKNLAAPENEGIYTVTDVGSGATDWVLTRATTYDAPTEINTTGLIVIQNGSTLSGTTWYNTTTIVTVDTTAFSYSQFGVYPISLANGGTAASLAASNGGIFYSNATTGAILSGTATAGLALLSGSSTTPSWSTLPPITKVVTQIFTGNGTYTPTTGMKYCDIICVGGGGGGGGVANSSALQIALGGGGGSGGYSRSLVTASTIGVSQAVTVGAAGTAGANTGGNGGNGGTTSVGAIISAAGGTGGAFSISGASVVVAGGLGGGTGTATLANAGNDGGSGFGIEIAGISGFGAGSYLGGASPSITCDGGATPGEAGRSYGAGGSGAVSSNASGAQAGGAGSSGVVYITEYISV